MEEKRININLEKLIDNEKQVKTSWSYQPIVKVPKPNGVTKTARPSMGVTSVMLKNLKKTNPKVSYTHCMPNLYLISAPHVFNPETIYPEAKEAKIVKTPSPQAPKELESTYDHLTRPNYNQIKQKSQKFQKNKSSSTARISRISVYTKKHLSAVNLNESQQYDTIIF